MTATAHYYSRSLIQLIDAHIESGFDQVTGMKLKPTARELFDHFGPWVILTARCGRLPNPEFPSGD